MLTMTMGNISYNVPVILCHRNMMLHFLWNLPNLHSSQKLLRLQKYLLHQLLCKKYHHYHHYWYTQSPHIKKSHQTPKCARVLTSAESLAYLQEKERKKKEEQELKELRKKEREKKRLEREQDKVRKQQQKEAKKKQQENKITQANKKDAGVENDTSKVDSLRPAITRKTAKRRRLEETESNNSKKSKEDDLQHNEISQNECAACFGTYEEDPNTGDLIAEWIQCTNKSCGVWSHCDCLDKTEGEYVCAIYQTTFH